MADVYLLVGGRPFKVKPGHDVETVIAQQKARGCEVVRCKKPPTIKTMSAWLADGIARATDGCRVEPDGACSHGHKSWLLVLGYI